MCQLILIQCLSLQKIWDSGLALSAWLFEVLESKRWNNVQHIEELHHRLGHQEGISASSSTEKRIVEIGAGTGLVAIALAACLRRQLSRAGDGEVEEAHEESPKFDILTTDLRELLTSGHPAHCITYSLTDGDVPLLQLRRSH